MVIDFSNRMTSNEVSSEIVKLEREVSELKREYKNLLARAQVNYFWKLSN